MSSSPTLFRISAAAMFFLALLALAIGAVELGFTPVPAHLALAFVAFGLFTLLCGFPHAYYGHVSFDRVAQYSSLLIFGPVAAAAINGVASLLYPWRRLRDGDSVRSIIDSSMANAGMMCLVILVSGKVYFWLGGRLPLTGLGPADLGPLLAMGVSAHVLTEGVVAWMVWTKGGDIKKLISRFEYAVELVSFLLAVVVAICYSRLDAATFGLLIAVMGVGMLVLHRFAMLRINLQQQVSERTEELQQISRDMERQAKHDVLTGLLNRRFVTQWLPAEIRDAQRDEQPLSLALGDLDDFKEVNDQHSHAVGDLVLQHCAKLFRAHLRRSDIVARYGGEEFLFCMPDTALDEALEICERLRAAVEAYDWSVIGSGLQITLSVGVTELTAVDTMESAIHHADHLLYAAKDAGRNCVLPAAVVD